MDCQRCGEMIDPDRVARSGRIKYCSDKCNKLAHQERNGRAAFIPEMRACERCGDSYFANSPFAKFCSKQCGKLSYREADRRVRQSAKGLDHDRPCAVCGAMFRPKRRVHVACSAECRYQITLQRMSESNLALRQSLVKPCKWCGEGFTPKVKSSEAYCSTRCRSGYFMHKARLAKYSLSVERFSDMLSEQGGGCAICQRPQSEMPKAMAIDHDHDCCSGPRSCGLCVRGLLCEACNQVLGRYEASGYMPPSFAEYLSKYQAEPVQLRLA